MNLYIYVLRLSNCIWFFDVSILVLLAFLIDFCFWTCRSCFQLFYLWLQIIFFRTILCGVYTSPIVPTTSTPYNLSIGNQRTCSGTYACTCTLYFVLIQTGVLLHKVIQYICPFPSLDNSSFVVVLYTKNTFPKICVIHFCFTPK